MAVRTGPHLYLIDASIYIFRAWFSMSQDLVSRSGEPVNALYGYSRFLVDLLQDPTITHLAVAFDECLTQSFRNDIYPEYKANRELPPPELEAQFQKCKSFTRACGVPVFADHRFEADDLIGTIAHQMRGQGFRHVIVSGDKDLIQVLDSDDALWDYGRDRWLEGVEVKKHWGITARQMTDYLGLVGDPVDNIPGVPGVGAKTAQGLLRDHLNLEQIYDRLDIIAGSTMRGAKRIAGLLRDHYDEAFLSRDLATIAVDAPLEVDAQTLRRIPPDVDQLTDLVRWMGIGQGLIERIMTTAGGEKRYTQ
ncbi:MAG: exodeoxyribonuclease IX [Gammaproteobacteria bacterium]|nr:exodeoxyribonuclease IX [Gammaproteobacteria bacterium]